MFTRLLSLGFCEKYNSKNETNFLHPIKTQKYFRNTVFHFIINSEIKEDYFCVNRQFRGYERQLFRILPKGGYFNPLEVKSQFYDNKFLVDDKIKIIERQPVFFVLLIPYPNFLFYNNYHNLGTEEWAPNPRPFINSRYHSNEISRNIDINKNINLNLSGEIKISGYSNTKEFINNFFDNNTFPFFIENHDELITLINDLDIFYSKNLGFNLNLENLSKIIIPFFELSQLETSELSKMSYY